MPITPGDILVVAKKIFDDCQSDEKYIRTVISEAYYSAFHTCEKISNQLPAVEYPAGFKPGTHQQLIDRLIKCPRSVSAFANSYNVIGRVLRQALDERIKADYHLNLNCTRDEGFRQIKNVEYICKKLEKICEIGSADN